jgi:hypothetical protein
VHFGCGSFRLSDVSEVITWMIAWGDAAHHSRLGCSSGGAGV